MAEEVKIIFTSDISGLSGSLKDVNKSLGNMQGAAAAAGGTAAGDSIDNLVKQFATT